MVELQERSKENKTVEITFGTVFKAKGYLNRFDVVTDIGEDSWFEASRIMKNKKGEEYLGICGTGGPENIESIVGQWDKERVSTAFMRFFGKGWDDKISKIIEKSAAKGSRLLELQST